MKPLCFVLAEEALANHGGRYWKQVSTATSYADHYVPAKEFLSKDSPHYQEPQGHPDFDVGTGSYLYESNLPGGSLHNSEMRRVRCPRSETVPDNAPQKEGNDNALA